MRIAALLMFAVLAASAQQPAPLVKPDAKSVDNTARQAMIESLNALAAKQTAARRAEVGKINTLAEAKARQTKVRATMLRLLGPLPEKTPLNAQVLGETRLDGFRLQKILFDSQPGFHVTALLYLPDSGTGKLPAIVMAPGHGATGKASDFAMASVFARNGFAVLSYDPIGQGERLQYPDPADPTKSLATRPTGEHAEASLQPVLIGESVAKYFLWDGIRAVDYLESRPEIDPKRIGAFGCSGGGAMTALVAALDTRIAATGTACYITSFDTLLPSIGPQDGEQSVPGWIANGLDFPDWVEVAAPRPYAIIATASDMFPYAGARASAAEARHFYSLFNPLAAGKPTGAAEPGVPIAPTLNPDTANEVSGASPIQFIVGPGGHGNLRPLQGDIVKFFLTHLAKSPAEPILPGAPPSATASSSIRVGSTETAPAGALQVTSTGQVSTAYPGSATVFSLNLAHALALQSPRQLALLHLQAAIREATGATARLGDFKQEVDHEISGMSDPEIFEKLAWASEPGKIPMMSMDSNRHPILLRYRSSETPLTQWELSALSIQLRNRDTGQTTAAIMSSRPAPRGKEEQKTPLLGDFYMLGVRAELSGETLLGLRVDDIIREVDYLSRHPTVDADDITFEASGHEALVLLHAAVLDPRIKHITVSNLPASYREMLMNPLPKDIAEDLVPGVLLHYDIPDLIRALGSRVMIVAK